MTSRLVQPSAPAGIRRVAILTVLAFGCATVRVPASTLSGTVPVHDGVAEPQLELWIESGKDVSPADSASATAQARAALQSALARVAMPQGDALLVVRAQGVTRTASRRSDQRAAVAGLVVGAVVIVAAVVVLLVASKGKGGGGHAPSVARAAPKVRPAPPRVRPALPPGVRPAPPVRVAHGGPAVNVDVGGGFEASPAPADPYAPVEWDVVEPPHGQPPAPQPWTPPAELDAISLPPPPPLDLDVRGFFEGDALRLDLVVVDRRTGAPLWTKVVERDVDPRDARAVERLLADAMADARGWIPASAPLAPPAQ